MLYRPLAKDSPSALPSMDPLLQSLTPCDHVALRRLLKAFNESKPAAILVGDGCARSSRVVDSFVAEFDDNTSVIRITTPCTDATSFMHAVVGSIGFEAKDFCLADLEKIFTMFLSHQRTHSLRTVLCFENAQDCDSWTINMISELTDLEAKEKFGLFVVVSGQRELQEMQYQMPLRRIAGHAGRVIAVSPLQLDETREFVLQQIQTEGSEDVGEIIQFEAITRLHEIGAGVADTVSGLCTRSMQLAEQDSSYPITENTISRAALALGLSSNDSIQDAAEFADDSIGSRSYDRLIFKLSNNAFGECKLDSDCVSIGRDRNNLVCIPSLLVSRHHVLIVSSTKGVKLMDLGSTNGTFVNGDKVNSYVLRDKDKIKLGDCEIEYAVADQA
ncbi:MAG: FHA domain-containing protein [Woeseiaceae bacterium]